MIYFKKDEFFYTEYGSKVGCYHKMDTDLLFWLDGIRCRLNQPITINASYDIRGHAKRSLHYQGRAIDFVVHNINYLDAFLEIVKFFKGHDLNYRIGVYPFWHKAGFHLDNGYIDDGQHHRYWLRDRTGEYIYLHHPQEVINKVFGL